MRVLVLHMDLHVLAGDARAMLMFADVFKYLGHEVRFLYTDGRPESAYYFRINELRDYHTVRYLDTEPVKIFSHREAIYGDFQKIKHENLRTQVYDYMIKLRDYDLLFTDEIPFMFWHDDVEWMREIGYIHYPIRPRGPRRTPLWANSRYIRRVIAEKWGRDSTVVYPPLHLDYYYPYRDYDERDYDAVFFGQFYRIKGFNVALHLAEMNYRVAIIGAKVKEDAVPHHRNIDIYTNLKVSEYTSILSNSKLIIHARPAEHFGITIAEGMASGCVPLVHASGGQYSDVIDYGRYGVAFTTPRDLLKKVQSIISDKEKWRRLHEAAIVGARRFSFRKIAHRVASLIKSYGG